MPCLGERARQFFVPMNEKIADITHADTLQHFLALAPVLHAPGVAPPETRKIIVIILTSERQAGTGGFTVYPNEGGWCDISIWKAYPVPIVIANGTQRLQYSLPVANDDFDLYCMGYVVEA